MSSMCMTGGRFVEDWRSLLDYGQANASVRFYWQRRNETAFLVVIVLGMMNLFGGDDGPKEREGGRFMHRDRDHLPNQATISFKDDNMVGRSPARKLGQFRTVGCLRAGGLQESLAQPFHEHLDHLPDPGHMVGKADFVLNRQQVVVATLLDFFGHVVGIKLESFG